MHSLIGEYTRFFTALLVILDPFMALPIFLSLTQEYDRAQRHRVATITTLTVIAVLALAALSGEQMLSFMGTSLASFRVGGGIVLLLMALAMLRAEGDSLRASPAEQLTAEAMSSIAVVPLAIPLLAGPGAISTVIIQMHRSSEASHLWMVMTVIVLVCSVLWLVLRLADPIGRFLGKIGLNIINRLFGLILTAIAIEIMANGLRDLFPVLAG
jgi:multiple antibiotic resistance protein